MGPGQEISGSVPCPISSAGFRPGGRGEGACAPGLEYFAARGGGGRVSPWGRGKGACAPGPEYFAACGGDLLCPLRQSRQSAAGNAADGLRLRCAPPRPIGPLFPDPCYGGILLFMDRNIPARGALSGQSQLPPGHWALVRWTTEEDGVSLPRLLRRSQRSRVVEVTTPSTTAKLVSHRTQRRAFKRRNHHNGKTTQAAAAVGEAKSILTPPAPLGKPQEEPNWRPP